MVDMEYRFLRMLRQAAVFADFARAFANHSEQICRNVLAHDFRFFFASSARKRINDKMSANSVRAKASLRSLAGSLPS